MTSDGPGAPRVLLCVDGGGSERLLEVATTLAVPAGIWAVLHVVDARGRGDLGVLRRGIAGASRLPEHLRVEIEEAGREHADQVIEATRVAFARRGLELAPSMVRLGEPGREICAAAAAWSASLVVIGAGRRPRPEPGPRSLGRTARFVVDHAPCPVLLVRGGRNPRSV